MSEPLIWLSFFVLAAFVGVEVISKVSSILHTPLMSGANAIHGVILVGAVLVAGSVVVDLAAEQGGNVAGVVPGEVVLVDCASGSGTVTLWGGANVPSQMPNPASRLYAQNVFNVIMLMTRDGAFDPDFDDEVVAGMCVTRNGEVLRQ